MRQIFAESLAAVVASTGSSAASALSAGLNGAITGWLDRKSRPKAPGFGSSYAAPGGSYPATPGGSDYPGYPSSQPAPAYPGTPTNDTAGYPGAAPPPSPGYPGNASPPQYPSYPGESSQLPAGAAQPEAYPGTASPYPGSQPYPGSSGAAPIYAGIAYEIHLIGPGGSSTLVDQSNHVFRTGDRFQVLYRPSLPGRVDVYNVNAAGQQAQIDTANVAAGQLANLGPYEFTDLTGNETLILSLSPCSTNALMTATRNIVKVMDASTGGPAPLQLSACGGAATRGLRTKTRDIRKVSVEQGTSFALDPLAAAELSSGDVAPRQVTITLAHR